jgi:hypothetical protein
LENDRAEKIRQKKSTVFSVHLFNQIAMKLCRTTELCAVQNYSTFGITAFSGFERGWGRERVRERERETERQPEAHTKFLSKRMKGKSHVQGLRVDGQIMVTKLLLKYILFAVRNLINTVFKLRCA